MSYLNTVPLVWGFLHGPQRGSVEIDFRVPSECARRVEQGHADLGIVPVVEIERQGLATVPGTGIACHGAVRSILLVSRVEPAAIRKLAVDAGSKTSVLLARIVLRRRYASDPELEVMEPALEPMLQRADACLLIGDAALRVTPEDLPYHVLDLGAEWCAMTGLPMVFAVWAGKRDRVASLLSADSAHISAHNSVHNAASALAPPLDTLHPPVRNTGLEAAFRESLQFGLLNRNTIIEEESRRRGLPRELVRKYLSEHIVFEIGPRENEGMDRFLQHAIELDAQPVE